MFLGSVQCKPHFLKVLASEDNWMMSNGLIKDLKADFLGGLFMNVGEFFECL